MYYISEHSANAYTQQNTENSIQANQIERAKDKKKKEISHVLIQIE